MDIQDIQLTHAGGYACIIMNLGHIHRRLLPIASIYSIFIYIYTMKKKTNVGIPYMEIIGILVCKTPDFP